MIHNDNHPGSVYVVFGKDDAGAVSTLALKGRGFKIVGEKPEDAAGFSVAGPGDLNSNGLDDILLGAPRPFTRSGRGKAYVVFGKADGSRVRLSELRGRGIKLAGGSPGDDGAAAVSGAGDVNGDGRPDLIVRIPFADPLERQGAGSVFVVSGSLGPGIHSLPKLGERGWRSDGAKNFDAAGWSVAGVGDMNADGIPELVVGAPQAGESRSQGKVYLLWGSP